MTHGTETRNTHLSRDAVFAWARELYANAVDHKDADGFAAAFAPDAWLRFGNAEPVLGRDAIRTAIAQFFTAFVALRHESRGAWLDGDTLFLEAVVTYTRHDQRQVSVHAVTIFRLTGQACPEGVRPVAEECRIYVDLAPLFAPAS
ncbi:MAG TPA: nuclear transport factor 2 family protein [Gemmatimonadaceae bacterium]